MRKIGVTLIAMLAVACSENSRGVKEHPDAARTVVEIRAMAYPDPSEGERPPRTFANTDEADLKLFERFLRERNGSWKRMSEPPEKGPMASCAMIYGDGRQLSFAVDDHLLIRGLKMLPLSDDEYATVQRICLRR